MERIDLCRPCAIAIESEGKKLCRPVKHGINNKVTCALQPAAIRNDIRACGHQKQSISTTTETLGFCLGSLIIFLGSRKWSPAPGGEGEEGGYGGIERERGSPTRETEFLSPFRGAIQKSL